MDIDFVNNWWEFASDTLRVVPTMLQVERALIYESWSLENLWKHVDGKIDNQYDIFEPILFFEQ